MIDADYKVVKPFGETHPGEVFQEYLDSNCWNQMIFARRMEIAPITKSEFCNANTMRSYREKGIRKIKKTGVYGTGNSLLENCEN